jgi:hypothetical protein
VTIYKQNIVKQGFALFFTISKNEISRSHIMIPCFCPVGFNTQVYIDKSPLKFFGAEKFCSLVS